MATVLEGISGLYVTLYNRAADSSGEEYWAQQVGHSVASAATAPVTPGQLSKLAGWFVSTQTSYFNAAYGSMTDKEFVEAIFANLGGADDAGAIRLWTARIADGLSRPEAVAQLVYEIINFDAADHQAALRRQQAFKNRLLVSLAYAANAAPVLKVEDTTVPAFFAAFRIEEGVTANDATREAALAQISAAAAANDLALITGAGNADRRPRN